jgi:D-beta-D-heptose 7-phosphate kinase / D-beta-D-heptose 1-phosphate adenosyltransferase
MPVALMPKEKILDLSHLLARVSAWRRGKQRIVFTNGCFDILHLGHITLLEHCRTLADRLIVGINSDASVRKLKGDGRPIFSESERARVLAALAVTDAIVIFGEDTPLNLIRKIRPEVLVKGGDYVDSTIVGAPEVKAWGGKVEIVPIVNGFSTTRILQRLQDELSPELR